MSATIRQVLDRLIEANEAYRNGAAIISDAEYDALEDQLADLVDKADPSFIEVQEAQAYLASIGAAPADDSGWTKVTHAAPMGSLNKAQTLEALRDWHTSCRSASGKNAATLIVTEKLDGISISLKYEGGQLVQALTRGDGSVGEDITRNVVKMKGVVHSIKGFDGHLRGEVILKKSDWKTHFPTYSNPRNAAGGISKRLDGQGPEHLTILHYQMIRDGGKSIPSKAAEFQLFERIGCAIPGWFQASSLLEAETLYQEYVDSKREALDYDIDGLVVEFNDPVIMESLGDLNKRPRGAVAWKFPHDVKPTILRNIRWQVGKSGRITPVAEFDVVDLAGVKVERASLHNIANIEKVARVGGRSGLSIGDTILVSRRNDVIPCVESLIQPAQQHGVLLLFSTPDNCPACNEVLIMQGEYLLCHGEDCPAQVLGGISRWVKKIGVLGIGDSLIEVLIEAGRISDAADLYTLDPKDIEKLTMSDGGRIGRTAHTIVDELKAKAELPLHTFVGSLGIPLCARSMCKTIVDAGYDSLDKMQAATEAQIASIPGMGQTKAEAFVTGLKARQTLMDKLQDNGVIIKAKAVGALTGQSVCFTGVRSPEMEKAIEDAGGTVKSSVGKGLTYLVAKDHDSGSEKTKKAANLGVKVVGVDDMWAVLGKLVAAPAAPVVVKKIPKTKTTKTPAKGADALDLFGDSD